MRSRSLIYKSFASVLLFSGCALSHQAACEDCPPVLITVERGAPDEGLCEEDALFDQDGVSGGLSGSIELQRFGGQRVSACWELGFDRPAFEIRFRSRAVPAICGSACVERCEEWSMLYVFANGVFLGAMSLDPASAERWTDYHFNVEQPAQRWQLCRPDYGPDGSRFEVDAVVGIR